MPYDEKLAERVRAVFRSEPNYTEQKIFGGICFMVGHNMSIGVTGNGLMVWPGSDTSADVLMLPHPRPRTRSVNTRPASRIWPKSWPVNSVGPKTRSRPPTSPTWISTA